MKYCSDIEKESAIQFVYSWKKWYFGIICVSQRDSLILKKEDSRDCKVICAQYEECEKQCDNCDT